MGDSEKTWVVVGILGGIILVCTIVVALMIRYNPAVRAIWNQNEYNLQKVDDSTTYETKKKVEDTCRSMIISYMSDKITYEQYKNSDSTEQRGWADQAKMRANKTAISYNEYILKNQFVWVGNIPDDIKTELEIIE